MKKQLTEIYHFNPLKDLFIRSVINSSTLIGVFLLIFVLTRPTASTDSIDQILFLPISILVFTGWIVTNSFEDDEKKRIIKKTILFIGFMFFILILFNINTSDSESQILTFRGFIVLTFLVWIVGFSYTLILDVIIRLLDKFIFETPLNNE